MEQMTIKCKDCGNTFEVSEGEQQWYAEKGFELPKRCKACRIALKEKRAQQAKDNK